MTEKEKIVLVTFGATKDSVTIVSSTHPVVDEKNMPYKKKH